MLLNLVVENLALIDREEVELGPGLNVLTGETGAGKSILLGAIGLALGGKASKDALRDPSKDAYVEVIFSVDSKEVERELSELEVDTYDGEIILSRRIGESRSAAKINGETVPIPKLKQVGELLLDIYGQHEHQSLLKKKKHLELLDQYSDALLGQSKKELKEAYGLYSSKKKELEEASMDASDRVRETSFLEQEIEEIETANLKPGEDSELEDLYRKMKNSEKIATALSAAFELTGGDNSASDLIGTALREMSLVTDFDGEALSGLQSSLMDCDGILSDFNHELKSYLDSMEFDQETFLQTESRLDLINTLKSRYGNTIEAVNLALEKKQERLLQLRDYDGYLDGLRLELQQLENEVERLSTEISKVRRKESLKLCQAVTEALQDLNFLNVQFTMEITELPNYTANGRDDAQFFISLNPGEPLRPLQDVASGGELSRIMLAIKTVLAEEDSIDTLIFDEIDAGISGRTAQKVSEKLYQVGLAHQVICISHLPQIASMADQNFLVEKHVENGGTTSSIRPLDELEKVDELARMLGGTEITDAVRMNAEEMLALAQQNKKRKQ